MRKLSLGIPIIAILLLLRASDTPHGSNFKMSCNTCHSSESWKYDKARSTFDHATTAFALTGQHVKIDCRGCHQSLVFSEAKKECSSCHNDVHEQTTGPECSRCHTTDNWLVTNISGIHRQTRFPLVGAHATADCRECHTSPSLLRFDPMGIECVDCHTDDYAATTSPNHASSGFSTNCYECHKVNAFEWNSGGFSHEFFPLTLGHAINECARCHKPPNYSNISPICVYCHQETYNTTQAPAHGPTGFSTDCALCHTTNPGWMPALFNHNFWPLTGGHSTQLCSKCHTNPNYTIVGKTCIECHQTNYNGTTNPNHALSGFSTACQDCHSTFSWIPASINHNFFPLTGGHNIQDCSKCHKNPNYTIVGKTCIECHQVQYNSTTNPNHAAAGFPTDCLACHTTISWLPATFNHDPIFPIYSGKHQGEWNSCTDCHTTPNNYQLFSCIDCHEHNKPDMDNEHEDVIGYQYNSNACYTCHPTGNEK